jgi:hypothetical protein
MEENVGRVRLAVASLLVAVFTQTASVGAADSPLGGSAVWDSVARVLQTPNVFAGGYHRFNLPRRDITLHLKDVTVAPELALGAWAGFSDDPEHGMLMGDLVLTSTELSPVLSELARRRIAVTAIHNHLVGEEPKLVYVHIHAMGAPLELAKRLDGVLALTATPRPVAAAPATPLTIDTTAVFRGLGRSGKARGSVAQLSYMLVPDKVTMAGMTVTPALGYGSPVNIQMVAADRAVATGDFAITGAKVAPLLQALAGHGITATALHTHMIGESPTVYFVHFWADGTLSDVTRGLKAAVDAAN